MEPALDEILATARRLRDSGDFAGAASGYRAALRLRPDDPDLLNEFGITAAQCGQLAEAIEAFRKAVAICPDFAQASHNLGVALGEAGRLEEAAECFRDALAVKRNYPEAYLSLANTLASEHRHEEAIAVYRDCLHIRPDSAEALSGLGLALTTVKRAAEAAIVLRQAVRLRPEMVGAHNNLGLALAEEGRYADAVAAYEEALRLDPKYAEGHVNLGNARKEQGRLAEAIACYDLALSLKPDSGSARWNRSLALLQRGDYEAGWREYEARWMRKGGTPPRRFRQPAWNGESLAGRTILVHAEQGLGDAIQFARYAKLLKALGATVILECPPPLSRIFSTCSGVDRLFVEGAGLPDFDVQAPLMSLPRLLRTRLDTVPGEVPYLFPDQDRVEFWGQRLSDFPGRKIGIAWQGNPHHQWDRHRSVPLSLFEALSGLGRTHLISLQRGPGTDQLDAINFPVVELLCRDTPDCDGVLDTAAIMQNLDLVVSVDTAVAHLAGAVAVPVWVLLSTMVDWRWLLNREDTPWYPTMRLFRQTRRGDWGSVFDRVAAELADPSRLIRTENASLQTPLISCLCVTRNRPALLRRAIECFDRQTHPRKQLVIVADRDDGPTRTYLNSLSGRRDVCVVLTDPKPTLGALRNAAASAAAGDYVAQWDDDDFYHPERLSAQLAEIRRTGKPACVLHRWLMLKDGRAVVSPYRHWEGSLLCHKSDLPRYPELGRGEDTPVVEHLDAAGKLTALDRPELYVYCYHGENTLNATHWDQLMSRASTAATPEEFPILAEALGLEGQTERRTNLSVHSRVFLSLCMIVRDSTRTLGACLESIRPWVDEMIVVDTGSTDDTPALAARLGARVSHFPWCFDFAAARNESLRRASGRWLFWMDSDDTIDPENGRKLRELAARDPGPSTLGYVMQVHCPGGDSAGVNVTVVDHVKMFRNLPGLRFEGRIHEQILRAVRRLGGEVAWTDVHVVHSGADHSPAGRRRKFKRDLHLLRLDLRDRPEHTFVLFNLGMTLADAGEHARAVDYLTRSLRAADPGESHVRKVYALLASSLYHLCRFAEAMKTCRTGLVAFPSDAELNFRAAMACHRLGKLEDAERHYRAALANGDGRHFASIDRGIMGFKARFNLAAVYLDMARPADALRQYRDVVEEAPDWPPGWRELINLEIDQGDVDGARADLDHLAARPGLQREGALLGARLARSRGDVSAAREMLEGAVCSAPLEVEPLQSLCRLLYDVLDPPAAAQALAELISRLPEPQAAIRNLGRVLDSLGRHQDALEVKQVGGVLAAASA